MNGLEQTYADRITFVRANILNPKSRPLMDKFGFSATPEFYLVDANDQVIGYWNDVVEVDVLQNAIDSALLTHPGAP